MKKNYSNGKYQFEIVDKVDSSYIVWNIGVDNMGSDEYIPMCQVYKDTYNVIPQTLKCVRMDRNIVVKVMKIAARKSVSKKSLLNGNKDIAEALYE